MSAPDASSLVTTVFAILGGLAGAAAAVAKLIELLNRGRDARAGERAEGKRVDIDSFRAVMESMEAENTRLREDLKRKDEDLIVCEASLDKRRDQVHFLHGILQSYLINFGTLKPEEMPLRPASLVKGQDWPYA